MAREVYEYLFDILFTIPSREISFKPYSLVEFTKECNYFTDFIPSYKLVCKIRDKHLNVLRIYDKEITVNIQQTMFYGETRTSLTNRKIISDLDFACYYEKEDLPAFMSSAKSTTPDLGAKTEYMPDTLGKETPHMITFYLLLKKDLKMKTFIHNYVFGSEKKGAAPIDAVMAIIEQNPHVEKVLIDPPDNATTYSDLIVEPAELKDAIRNVQYKYGIYGQGLQLFYDNGLLYVLNKFNIYHSIRKDELQIIQIRLNEKKDNPNPVEHALVNTDEGYIGYERMGTIHKEDYESIEGILNGDKFVYSNFGTVINAAFGDKGKTTFVSPLNEVSKPRPSRIDVGVRKIVDYDMLNNPYNMSSFMFEGSKGVPISFMVHSMNEEHFSPNKIIKMSFDTQETMKLYSGLYSIQSAVFVYKQNEANPAKVFNAIGHVALSLCNKQEGYDKDYKPQ